MTCVTEARRDTLRVAHDWVETDRHENEDRTRTRDRCQSCGAERHGCFAKRTGAGGQQWWGPVGVWTYSVGHPGRTA